jgi:hypothetical protein
VIMSKAKGLTRAIVVVVMAALTSVPAAGVASASEPGTRGGVPSQEEGTLLASARRAALAEPLRTVPQDPKARDDRGNQCGASVTERVAFLYLLVGGAVLLYYGPKEREGDRLTVDGWSEGVAGAASIGLSFALLRDILKKRPAPRHP